MDRCKKYKDLIKSYLLNDLSDYDEKKLKEHITGCTECKKLYTLHQSLQSSLFKPVPPDSEKFTRMRNSVLRIIRAGKDHHKANRYIEFLAGLKGYALKPAIVFAIVIGFLLGRAIPPDSKNILQQMSTLADKHVKLIDIQNSPYSYSNISFKEIDKNSISLSFNVTTHIDIVRSKDDPLVKDVLTQALLKPQDVGSSLKTISYTETIIDQKFKDALIFSMHNAPILAVRLKALRGLLNYKYDEDLSQALFQVLKEEDSMQMRLLAIEYLIDNRIEPEKLKKLLSDLDTQKNIPVILKAKQYIEQ